MTPCPFKQKQVHKWNIILQMVHSACHQASGHAIVLSSASYPAETLFPVPASQHGTAPVATGTEKPGLHISVFQTFSFVKRNKPDTILRKKKNTSFFL